jgi:hypothetical protein
MAGALLFDEKISQSAAQPVIRAPLGDTKPLSKHKKYSSRILGTCLAEKIVVCAQANHLPILSGRTVPLTVL